MKNLKLSLYAMMAFIMLTSACTKKGDTLLPIAETDGNVGHEVLWSHQIIQTSSFDDIIPAIDDNDNVYLSVADLDEGNIKVYAIDKNGNEIWNTSLDGESTSRVIFANASVFVSTSNPTSVYCLNAQSGSLNWSKNLSEQYDFSHIPYMAFANDRLYLSTGQLFDSYLMAYDNGGNELWLEPSGLGGGIYSLTVVGSSLFSCNMNVIVRFDDLGNNAQNIWSKEISNYGKGKSLILLPDLPIVNNQIFIRHGEDSLSIISTDGELVNRFAFDFGDNYMNISNLTINSSSEIFIGNGDLQKYNASGSLIWESDIHDGLIVNPSFNSAPVIANSGNLYDAQAFGLYAVTSGGSLSWKVNAENYQGWNMVIYICLF